MLTCVHDPFLDHKDGEGVILKPKTILRMRVEGVEVPQTELSCESKSQKQSSYKWITKILSNSETSKC